MNLANAIATAILISVIGLTTTVSAGPHKSDQDKAPIVYRIDGVLTEDSRDAIKVMKKAAKKNGYVTLWLTANTPFDWDFDNMSSQQIKDQEREVEAVFAAALRKLVQKGSVRHPSGEPNIQGPGCIVQAKVRGLEKIVKDERILQIVGLPNERR